MNLRILQKKGQELQVYAFDSTRFWKYSFILYALLYIIQYHLRNKKNECQKDELKKDIENDQLYDPLSVAKKKL